MDSKFSIVTQMFELAANRRIRAFSIGVLVLAVLAVLQVNNLKRNTPMCDLLVNSNLCNTDLQRMQIALSQSGLDEFRVKDNRIMVPVAKHAEYLHAIAEQNAIPEELRQSSEETAPSVNPFLSKSQQIAIERIEKKRQVRDMVLRLPFVEQAWFEMDKSESHSAFERDEHSAVVSIRTPKNTMLTDQHVDTVKRMIGGAVAGLGSDNIVVIDLSAGFAHHKHLDASTSRQVHYQRIAIEQQRFYENQIRDILKDYPGIKVSVHVEVEEGPDENYVASLSNAIPMPAPPTPTAQLPTHGANGFASIEPIGQEPESTSPPIIQLITHTTEVESSNRLDKKISVSIDVPQKLVHDLFGAPMASSSFAISPTDLQTKMADDTNKKFAQLRSEIIQKVRPLLPQNERQTAGMTPITVNLIRHSLPESTQWIAKAKDFATQNWPSAAVLALGLMLLSIVTRKPARFEQIDSGRAINENGDELSINSPSAGLDRASENSDVRLTKLIEKDPDAAARVIEAWIRDAA